MMRRKERLRLVNLLGDEVPEEHEQARLPHHDTDEDAYPVPIRGPTFFAAAEPMSLDCARE